MLLLKYLITTFFNIMKPIEVKIPQIQWFNNGEKPNEELDKLSL